MYTFICTLDTHIYTATINIEDVYIYIFSGRLNHLRPTRTHAHTHLYIYIYIYAHTAWTIYGQRARTHTHKHMYIYTCAHSIPTYTQLRFIGDVYICILSGCINHLRLTRTHTHTHTHIHIYVHTQYPHIHSYDLSEMYIYVHCSPALTIYG